ncbi:cryptochrome, DASH family [Stanieria cyanosphaera PCC 7437]|uniref:Cryptochrome DASH n=1 Tax=Stanieria cyanosphaera (strain ATCC 29371 / PCC 7437) TaxID=111780 RepID=K9XV78_STAC7|nr:DASH family cryptochrome [Stanieria cyanosphaera]AFZ36505.1 cryptochrome, DASH family [Stanieria cyanosphaera PCC 7437]
MSKQRILIWFRNDLRLHDHKPIYQAVQEQAQIIPVYCFDQREFKQTSFGFPKTGNYRAQFLLESVADLKKSLQKLGSDLIIYWGFPEQIIPHLAQKLKIDSVYYHQEVTAEELKVEQALKQELQKLKIQVNSFWGATLYLTEDLPFEISQIPELYTNFRKQVEAKSTIENPLPTPKELPSLPSIELGQIPQISDLGLTTPIFDKRAVLNFKGGETEALTRLNQYFWQLDCLKEYKETRNGMLGANYSSKFSPWLARGCISPRYIYEQVQKYETKRIKNDSTYWLIFELIWRDFFHFICAKHGNKIFYQSGLQGIDIPWKEDWKRFNLWQEGKTGYPLVDANMRELAATGFMSNRGRQNVASFLTKNLGINWQIGAEWFESLLVDYDVCSNWGNWNYTAGVGNDARGFRYFNIPKQSKYYDPKGDYLRHWLPELALIPGSKIHEPWKLTSEEQKRYQIRLGTDYPYPVVDFFKSVKANEKIYNNAINRE